MTSNLYHLLFRRRIELLEQFLTLFADCIFIFVADGKLLYSAEAGNLVDHEPDAALRSRELISIDHF